MIKGVFKIIFALLILAILSPFVILGLMYRGNADAAIPTEDYIENVDIEAVIADDIDLALTGLETPGEDIVLSLSDATINAMVYAFLTGENGLNPNYQPGEECEGDDCAFFTETFEINQNATGTLRLTGVWVEFIENQIRLHLNASMQYNDGFTYATQVRLDVIIEDRADQYYLALDRVSLGRLPITQTFFNRVLGWVESATDQSLENPDNFPVGTLDLSTLSLSIPKAEIITQIDEDPDRENGETFATLLGLVFDNELLTFAVESGTFDVTLKSSKLFNDEPLVLDAAIESVYDNPESFDPTTQFAGLLESFLLTAALSERNELVVNEVLLNQILAQSLAENDALAFTQTFAGIDGTLTELNVNVNRLLVDLTAAGMQLVIAITINDAPANVRLTLNEMDQIDPLSLTYEVTRMTIGEDSSEEASDYLSIDDVTPLLNAFKDQVSTAALRINDEAHIILDASILTATLESSLAAGGVELEGLAALDNALILNLAFDATITTIIDVYGDALDAFLADELSVLAIETVMSGFPTEASEDFVTAMNALSDDLTAGAPSGESIDQFIDAYTGLSGTEKTTLNANLRTIIEASIIDEFEGVLPD